MQKPKSHRHVIAAQARWRAGDLRAEAARAEGIPDRSPAEDLRQPVLIDLTSYGGCLLRIEPRRGYIAVRVIDDDTGEVLHLAAMKEALHWVADKLPRMLSARACDS